MTSKALAQVLVRILGVYFIAASLATVGNVLMFLGPNQFRATVVGASLNVIVTFVVGIILVRNGDGIGAWLTSDFEPAEETTTTVNLLPVALAIFGVWFLVAGLRSAAVVGVEFLARPKFDETPGASYIWDRHRQALVTAVVDTIAGIILISGREGIANAWARLRGRD
jgi:hypothetical protein